LQLVPAVAQLGPSSQKSDGEEPSILVQPGSRLELQESVSIPPSVSRHAVSYASYSCLLTPDSLYFGGRAALLAESLDLGLKVDELRLTMLVEPLLDVPGLREVPGHELPEPGVGKIDEHVM